MRRKVEALLLKLNEDNAPQALAEPTLGAVIDVYLREERPERPESQQNLPVVDGTSHSTHLLMAELACNLRLRICEVLGLKWENYDPVAKTLSIQRSAVDGVVGDVKSEASRDVIPL